jgi:hypothetical protein
MQHLSLMSLADRIRSLQFNDDVSIYNNVCSKYPNQPPRKLTGTGTSASTLNPASPRAIRIASINRFKKPKTELVINLIEHPNDPLG